MITTGTRRHDLVGNATAGPFTYQFMVPSKSYLSVYVDGALKTVDTHYTVTGIGEEDGGTVTFTSGNEPGTNAEIILLGAEPYTQDLALQEAAQLPAASLEEALDKQIRLAAQLNEQLTRTPKMAVTDAYGLSSIGLAAPSAGQYLRWDAGGQNLEPSTPTTVPSGLPVGGNYDHLTINGSGTVTWDQQIYNFSSNFVNVSKYASFATAVSSIGATKTTLLISSVQTVSGNVTVPSTLTLWFVGQGQLSIDNGVVVTINGPLFAPLTQIFSGAGSVAGFGKMPSVYPQWWGATGDGATNDTTALQAAITAAVNNRVVLPQGTYKSGLLTITNPVEIMGLGPVTLSWNAANAALRIDADITWVRFAHFKIVGSGVLGDAQYGILANGANRIVTDCYIENVTVSNCMVGFELSAAVKLVMIAPKVLTTVGELSGQGYGILIGFGGANRNQDCYILAPYLYRTTRHGLYVSGGKRTQIISPMFYQHRNGDSGDIERAALAASRGENITITNPQFIECAGEIFSFDDDNILTGGASMLQMQGGFSIAPQSDGGSIRIAGGTSADANIAKVIISNFFLDCNSTYTNSEDLRIYDAVDVVISGCFFAADKSYAGDRSIVLVQNNGSSYDGSVFIHGNAGHITGSANKRFVRVANGIETGTRSVLVFNNVIEGLSTSNLNGLIYAGTTITNPNVLTDSIQEIEITGATPTVSHGKRFRLTQGAATNVTNFLGGYEGHRISIRFMDGNSTIKATNIYTASASDFVGTANDMMMLEYRNGAWREVCRSVN